MSTKRFLFLILLIFIILGAGCNKDNVSSISTISAPTLLNTPTPAILITPVPTISPALNDDMDSNNTVTLTLANNMDVNLNEYLCSETEEVIFSFNIANSDKTASICISKSQPDYIVYRFGTKDNIEVEYPGTKDSDSWSKFTYSYYVRGGGTENDGLDLNYLIFDNGRYEYQIYDEYSSEDDKTSVGITVTDLDTGDETDIKGISDSIQGSLITLRDNKKINIVIQ